MRRRAPCALTFTLNPTSPNPTFMARSEKRAALLNIMGAEEGAEAGELKKRFQNLMHRFHPDRNPAELEDLCRRTARCITEAYFGLVVTCVGVSVFAATQL